MAEKNVDPTDPSDPSATPESRSDDATPTGEELVSEHPGRDVSEERLDETDADPGEDASTDAEPQSTGSTAVSARGARRPVRRTSTEEPAPSKRPRRSAATVADDEPLDDDGDDASAEGTQVAKKNRPTPRQRTEVAEEKRTTPPQFVRESAGELRKVVWPTGEQMRGYFVVVLVFVLFIIAYVSLIDLGLGWALLRLLG